MANDTPSQRRSIALCSALAAFGRSETFAHEGVVEVVKTTRFVGVTMRGEVNSSPVPRNCVLEAARPPEALETKQ